MDNNAAPFADLQVPPPVPPLFTPAFGPSHRHPAPSLPQQLVRAISTVEGHHDEHELSEAEGPLGTESHTSISDISESGAPVTPPATHPIGSQVLSPFLLLNEASDGHVPNFIFAPPPPTSEQRANSMGMNLIRLLLLRPSPETFGPGHRLIVNRVVVEAADRTSVIPLPINILRMECSGVDTHTPASGLRESHAWHPSGSAHMMPPITSLVRGSSQ